MHLYNISTRQSCYNKQIMKQFSKSIYPNAQSVSAWGGEDDETPIYGVVKIALKQHQVLL